ncbi:hypothetical protein GCM10011575_43100 [Microlunatus endophyticus]|uniref:Uncharacterized protein n=1 Tax=Microlunatus endophyticus TaxID=1716077 RepID=A0A917SGY9_9ACTN|nr:hypothetical protein [Microlunatus endophyticus]GGL80216.1 hypothetical protein GCM10011575_43100 [Microlunatus endophyticus]
MGDGTHSSAAEVTRALLALKSEGDKFTMSLDRKGRIVASWFLANMGSSEKLAQYRISLRGETGEYTSWQYDLEQPNTHGNGQLVPSYSYSFKSKELTDPVDAVLAAHGWVEAAPWLVRFFLFFVRPFRRGEKRGEKSVG